VDKERGKESPAKKIADMDSLCEEISRAIVEGLEEKEILDEPELGSQGESHFAETAVIGSLDEAATGRLSTAVESLLESNVLSQKIVLLVQEKIHEILNDDAEQGIRGDSGVIAERVHAECARLFEGESFKREVVELLRADVEHSLAPALRRDMFACVRNMVTEIAGVLVERVAGEFTKLRAAALQPQPAGIAPVAELSAASCAAPFEAPRAAPAGAGALDRPEPRLAAPPPPRPQRSAPDAEARAASAYLRIRDRLLWREAL